MNPGAALTSVVGLLGLWIGVYYLWQDFRNDAFRDDIFCVRDQMFLFAANGNISFNHPAYTNMRDRMNALLRHGLDFTLTRLFILLITHRDLKSNMLTEWEASLADLPVETQEKMKEINVSVAIFVLQHIVFLSFFRYMALRPLMFLVTLRKVIAWPPVESSVEQLENQTIERDKRHLGSPLTA